MLPALDARMQDMYLGVCVGDPRGGLVTVAPPVLIAGAEALAYVAERLPLWRRVCGDPPAVVAIGEGWKLVAQAEMA